MSESVTTPKTRKMLESQPHIDIRRLREDDRLLIEAGPYIYEMRILSPDFGLVEITSSDPRLKTCVGTYICGFYNADDIVNLDYIVAAALKMKVKFISGYYLSAPMISARLIGKGFHYDVF